MFFLGLFSVASFAQFSPSVPIYMQSVNVYAEFVGGLKINDVKSCVIKMQGMCQEILSKALQYKDKPEIEKNNEENPMITYATCMRQQMEAENSCKQSLAILNKLKPDFVEIINIAHYDLFDAVETKINKDDKQRWYFIVNNYGEFIDTREVHAEMRDSTTYPYFIRKYPNAVLDDVQPNFPPRFETLMLGDIRLVFVRSIIDKINNCVKCKIIGMQEEGYDFKRNGQFKWVKFIRLIPNEPL